MKLTKVTLLSLIATTFLATSAIAHGDRGARGFHDGPGFGMPGMRLERMAEHLDLDDAQRESVKNIMEAAKPEIKALRERARDNRKALRNIDPADPQVQNLAIENGELATEGTLLFARVRGEIHAVLTDEQRAKLAEFQEKRKDRREERRQKRQ